jgi:hypothetical protein
MSRNGTAGFIPKRLEHLLQQPDDLAAFQDLWPELCSEGTAWSAAYAAAPYIIEIAQKLSPAQRFEHVFFVGCIARCECPDSGESFRLQPYLAESYHHALREGLVLVGATLACAQDADDTRHLLASISALKGHRELAEAIEHLDCGCPHCGKEILS